LEKTAHQLGLKSRGEVQLCHLLFGGLKEVQPHNLYEIEIEGITNGFCSDLKVLGHQQICGGVPKMIRGPWMGELRQKKIFVNGRRHLSFNAVCFSKPPQNLSLFPIISFLTVFGF